MGDVTLGVIPSTGVWGTTATTDPTYDATTHGQDSPPYAPATGSTVYPAKSSAIPRDQIIVLSRAALILDNGVNVGYSEKFIQPEQIIHAEDGFYYLVYTGTGTTGYSFCLARATSPAGPYTDLGSIYSSIDGAHIIFDGTTYHIFGGATSALSGVTRYTATVLTGPYTLQSTILTVGAAGSPGDWDADRCCEPFVMLDPRPNQTTRYLMFYMGLNTHVSPQTEQIGLATATGLSGSWTKVTSIATPAASEGAGSGLILAATGSAANPNGREVSDPWCVYLDGIFYLFYSAAWGGSAVGTAYVMLATATDPINGPWTNRGIVMERGIWPAADAASVNRGSFYWDEAGGLIYYPYQGNKRTVAAGVTGAEKGYLAILDPAGFIGGPREGTWIRKEAETADASIQKTGTWANEGNVASSNGNDSYTNTIGDKIDFHFSGRRVRVGSQANAANGIVTVKLDGVTVSTVDCYDADGGNGTPVLIYDSGYLTTGHHKVTVTLTGKNASASDKYLIADYFEYMP